MKREEFLLIGELQTLMEFARSKEVAASRAAKDAAEVVKHFYKTDELDRPIQTAIDIFLRQQSWQALSFFLDELRGYQWYYYDGGTYLWGVSLIGDEFKQAKTELLEALDANDFWGSKLIHPLRAKEARSR